MTKFANVTTTSKESGMDSQRGCFEDRRDRFYEQDHYDKNVASVKEDIIMKSLYNPLSNEYYKYLSCDELDDISSAYHQSKIVFEKTLEKTNKNQPTVVSPFVDDIDEKDIEKLSNELKHINTLIKEQEIKQFYDEHGYTFEFKKCVTLEDQYKCFLQDKELLTQHQSLSSSTHESPTHIIKKKKISPNGGLGKKGKSSKRGRRFFKKDDNITPLKGAYVTRNEKKVWKKINQLTPNEKTEAQKQHVVDMMKNHKKEKNSKQRLRNKKNKEKIVVEVNENRTSLVAQNIPNVDDVVLDNDAFETEDDYEQAKLLLEQKQHQEKEDESEFLTNIREKTLEYDLNENLGTTKDDTNIQEDSCDHDDEDFIKWACDMGWVRNSPQRSSRKTKKSPKKNKNTIIYMDKKDVVFESCTKVNKTPLIYKQGKHVMFCKFVKLGKKCVHKHCKFAHTVDELTHKPCSFDSKCRHVRWIENRCVNNTDSKRVCVFWHQGETCEMYASRHGLPYTVTKPPPPSIKHITTTVTEEIKSNTLRKNCSKSQNTWAKRVGSKVSVSSDESHIVKNETEKKSSSTRQQKSHTTITKEVVESDQELEQIKKFCNQDFKTNQYIPFLTNKDEKRDISKHRPYVHKEQPITISTTSDSAHHLLKYLVNNGYSNINIKISTTKN